MNEFGEVWLNLGCGVHPLKNFINIDSAYTEEFLRENSGKVGDVFFDEGAVYLQADVRKLPYPDNFADYIMSVYMIEHLPIRDVVPALTEWLRVLKPNGYMHLVTCNFDDAVKDWHDKLIGKEMTQEWFDRWQILCGIIYGNQYQVGEFHNCPFNPQVTNWFMQAAGAPYWELQVYPDGYPCVKPKGYPFEEGFKMWYGEIHVIARKTIPEGINGPGQTEGNQT